MATYLLIESRDPFESADSAQFSEMVNGIAKRGHEVTLFLLQNGVMPLRPGAKYNSQILQLLHSKVKVFADQFSLKERAIRNVVEGVQVADMDTLVKFLVTPDTKTIWH